MIKNVSKFDNGQLTWYNKMQVKKGWKYNGKFKNIVKGFILFN